MSDNPRFGNPYERMKCGHLARFVVEQPEEGTAFCLACELSVYKKLVQVYETRETLTDAVQSYYQYRYQGNEPDDRQSLLWLISELAELSQAWRNQTQMQLDAGTIFALDDLEDAGEYAEQVVRGERDWKRNNDRVKEPNLADEVGDVLMMLTRLCIAANLPDPQECMTNKFAKKGWTA